MENENIPVPHLGIVICVFNIKEYQGKKWVKYPRKKNGRKEISGQTLGGNSSSNEVSISLGARSRNVLLLAFFWGRGGIDSSTQPIA